MEVKRSEKILLSCTPSDTKEDEERGQTNPKKAYAQRQREKKKEEERAKEKKEEYSSTIEEGNRVSQKG